MFGHLKPIAGRLAQAAPHESGSAAGRSRGAVRHAARRSAPRREVARERLRPRQHLVEHGAETEDVRPAVSSRLAPARVTCTPPSEHRSASGSRDVRVGQPSGVASPKSSNFAVPSGVTRTFAGFRSRWTMPLACAASSAAAISRPASAPLQAGRGRAVARRQRTPAPNSRAPRHGSGRCWGG